MAKGVVDTLFDLSPLYNIYKLAVTKDPSQAPILKTFDDITGKTAENEKKVVENAKETDKLYNEKHPFGEFSQSDFDKSDTALQIHQSHLVYNTSAATFGRINNVVDRYNKDVPGEQAINATTIKHPNADMEVQALYVLKRDRVDEYSGLLKDVETASGLRTGDFTYDRSLTFISAEFAYIENHPVIKPKKTVIPRKPSALEDLIGLDLSDFFNSFDDFRTNIKDQGFFQALIQLLVDIVISFTSTLVNAILKALGIQWWEVGLGTVTLILALMIIEATVNRTVSIAI